MLTQAELKLLLSYDQITGVFTWIAPASRRIFVGMRAGATSNWGYIIIGIRGKRYRANRLAWLYMKGEWPDGLVDHKNLDKSDNAWINLRLASKAENGFNSKAPITNTTGFKGVYKSGGGFRAQLRVNGTHTHLGCFERAEDAYVVYCEAVERHRGEFGRTA